MAFVLRRPTALLSTCAAISKPQTSRLAQPAQTSRLLHQTARTTFQSRPTPTSSILLRSRSAFRAYSTPVANYGTNTGSLRQRLLYGAGIFGGTLLAANLIFNRETREEGMPLFERAYLNDTFMHTGLGLGIIALAARTLHTTGWSFRLMSTNPWILIGGGLVASIGTMYGCMATSPDNYVAKYGMWTAFNLTQAALLSPMMFFAPALLARAGLYTVAMMGSLAIVGATAKTDKYLYLGGPLLAGVAIVAVSGLAPLVLPVTAVRTLAVTENIWLWGGLAVFGGFTLYDIQKVLQHARLAERGLIRRDPVNESISLELDFINIFVRMVQILAMQQRKK